MRSSKSNMIKRIIAYILPAAVLVSMLMSVTAFADDEEQKAVRVGWFNSSFCYYDQFGRRCGVDY